MEETAFYTTIQSPVGELLLTASDAGLTGLTMEQHCGPVADVMGLRRERRRFATATEQLREYFAGDRTAFDLPLDPSGTAFQLAVWEQLRLIPFGETITYLELADRVGRPGAPRAAGLANSRNPISIVIPCHRVVGSSGALTGYGGGIDRKAWLLTHEGALPAQAGRRGKEAGAAG
jgi:methylated-DNA-[protein]-cysteine S-methyltransferase